MQYFDIIMQKKVEISEKSVYVKEVPGTVHPEESGERPGIVQRERIESI